MRQKLAVPEYVHLRREQSPPRLKKGGPFKAVLAAESEVPDAWKKQITEWLIQSGCRYFLSCGKECRRWEDSADWSNRTIFGDEPSDDDFVMTTSHPKDTLDETFWFCDYCAEHPSLELERIVLVHIAATRASAKFLDRLRIPQFRED